MNKATKNYLPIIGITMGDPAGVGPEVTVRLLASGQVHRICRPLVLGSPYLLKQAAKQFAPHLRLQSVASPAEAHFHPDIIDVLEVEFQGVENILPGKLSAEAGRVAFLSIEKGIQLAQQNQIDAIVTNPIHKEALHIAGIKFAGHTEIFAHYTKTPQVSMLLVHKNLRVAHVTTHVPLRQACDLIKRERILKVILLLHDACKMFGVHMPRIGVAGLNPHASDGGLFGDEDLQEIQPAVAAASEMGVDARGPISPDILFCQLQDGLYDGVVAMYHDQGHIPFKMNTFRWDAKSGQVVKMQGVNVTLGLPIIRTSVDHGTAFDIAWKGIASTAPLMEAIEIAVLMALHKHSQRNKRG